MYLGFGVAAFLVAYSAGAAVPLSEEEAAQVRKEFSEQIQGIDQTGIFFNNFKIAWIMFIPAVGAGFGAFSGFETGSVFSALASSSALLAKIPPLIILITPFGIMEVFAYGLAMSRSGMLIVRIVKDKPWREGNRRPFLERSLVPAFVEIGIVAAVLLAAAVIEWQMIEQAGGIGKALVQPV